MTQGYINRGLIELTIIDNGITIAGSLKQRLQNLNSELPSDSYAILHAIKGYSSKDERGRGYGLGTTLYLIIKCIRGEVLIVSGAGLFYMASVNNGRILIKELDERSNGTLISMRLPINTTLDIDTSDIGEKVIDINEGMHTYQDLNGM